MKYTPPGFLKQVIVAGLVSLAAGVSAQTPNAPTKALSLKDCIELALKHNLNVQIERYNPLIARHNLGLAYGDYDPTFQFSGSHDYSLAPGGIDPQGRIYGGTETDSDRFTTSISGLLPWGLTYNLGGSASDTYGTRPAFDLDLSNPMVYTNSFVDLNTGQSISYLGTNYASFNVRDPFGVASANAGFLQLRQPLLRDFMIDGTRLNIWVSKKNLKISDLVLRQQIMSTVNSVEQSYYDLIFAFENVRVQETALGLADRLLADNKIRVQVGALAQLDEKSSESQVQNSRADLLTAQRLLAVQQNVLKSLITDQYTQWHEAVIQPTESLQQLPTTLDLLESWRRALALRPDLLQLRTSVERQNIVLRYDKNQLLPRVDAVGSYGYAASGLEFNDAFGQIKDRENPFYSFGATLSVPLSNRRAKENYRVTKAEKEQLLLRLKKLEQDILVQIDDAVKLVRTQFERVNATRAAREFAREALEAEQKKLEHGKSTPYNVLLLQRDLTLRSSEEIRALAEYNKAVAQHATLEGTILERNRVDLQVR